MEILRFVLWRWRTWESWQRWFIIAMLLLPLSMVVPPPWNFYLNAAPLLIVFGYMLKWAVWDSVKNNWAAYKKSRQELFDQIRDSDR